MRPRGRKDFVKYFWKAVGELAKERNTRPSRIVVELIKVQIQKALEGDYRFLNVFNEKVFFIPEPPSDKPDAIKIIFEDVSTGGNRDEGAQA